MAHKQIYMVEYNRSESLDGSTVFEQRILGETYPREDNSGIERECINILEEYEYGKLIVTIIYDNGDEHRMIDGICHLYYQLKTQ